MIDKRYIYQWLLLPLFACLTAGMAGCSNDMTNCADDDGDSRYVDVRMNIGTRAEGTPTAGTSQRETNIESVRVYAFTGEQQVGFYRNLTSLTNVTEYQFTISIKKTGSSDVQPVEFYIIANEAGANYGTGFSWKDNMTRSELDNIKFTALVDSRYLPATLKRTGAIDFSAGATNDIGTLELEHPVGKLSVSFRKEVETTNLVVTEIKVERILEYNYLMAGNTTEVPVSSNMAFTVTPNASIISTTDFTDVLADTPYYPFECSKGVEGENWDDASANVNKLTVSYKVNSNDKTKVIHMPPIERNSWHDFQFTVKANAAVELKYDVDDWKENDLEIGLDYPQTNSTPGGSGYTATTYWSGENNWDGAFSMHFEMVTPVKGTCKVSLHEYTHFALRVLDDQGNEQPDYIINGGSEPYTIQVRPLQGLTESVTVDLSITLQGQEWYGEDSRLLINPNYEENNAEAWPGGKNFIRITQVAPASDN